MRKYKKRTVICLSLEGVEIKRYDTLKEVCIEFGTSKSLSSYLLNKIREEKPFRGYMWRFEESVELQEDEVFVKHYRGFEVSNFGTVRSKSGFLTKGNPRSGYLSYTLGPKSWYMHRLVAEAFLPNPNKEPTVNHIDKNKLNNKLENLEWASYKRQANHRDE